MSYFRYFLVVGAFAFERINELFGESLREKNLGDSLSLNKILKFDTLYYLQLAVYIKENNTVDVFRIYFY